MTAVFVSACARARSRALPALVSGFETEVDLTKPLLLVAADAAPEGGPPTEDEYLVGRDTGHLYRGLPWFEAHVP